MTEPMRAVIVTISDRCSRGAAVDTSGPALAAIARQQLGAVIVHEECVPDDAALITAAFTRWSAPEHRVDLILSTGGTGLAPRDVTPEALRSVVHREHPALMELARLRCLAKTPRAFLSRGIAGTMHQTLIITLPGSTRGCSEMLEALLDVLPHAVATLRGEDGGHADPVAAFFDAIVPIVLVGGQSRRFGRGILVERAIGALRGVFGARVVLVGDCDGTVAECGDRHCDDRHPGKGPLGGIVTALQAFAAPVFVLAGDMPSIRAEHVQIVVQAAWDSRGDEPRPWAILGMTDRVQPCLGLYLPEALPSLECQLAAATLRLHEALPAERVRTVALPAEAAVNVNRPADLASGG